MPFLHHEQKPGMGTFKRGLTISPFQIPLLAYFFFQGLATIPVVGVAANELAVPEWTIWNFIALMVVGSGVATFSRFNANERLEAFGLHLIMLALVVVALVQVSAHKYDLGDELAIFLGCWLRSRVLRQSRKAEKVAIKIATDVEEKP